MKFGLLGVAVLLGLVGCGGRAVGDVGVRGEPNVEVLVGQVYPSGELVLDGVGVVGWPERVMFVPLYEGVGFSGEAVFVDVFSDRYVPGMMGMPDVGPCVEVGYLSVEGFDYWLGEEIRIQDYFGRAFFDHCLAVASGGRYRVGGEVGASFPVVAFSLGADVSYESAGRGRVLLAAESLVVDDYIAAFESDYLAAYGVAVDDPENVVLDRVSSLRDAVVFLEADVGGGVLVEVASWERMSVGLHLYRVWVLSWYKGGELVRVVSFEQHLGGL